MVAGAVRLVYAVIYSLFIGFGLTMGIAIYGVIDRDASSETQCTNPISAHGYWVFFFVPAYTMCLMIINQAKWRQMPLMLVISFVGYLVNYFSALRFAGNAQVSSAFASLAIAFLANMYSRVGQRFNVHISQVGKKITTMLMSTFSPVSMDQFPISLEELRLHDMHLKVTAILISAAEPVESTEGHDRASFTV